MWRSWRAHSLAADCLVWFNSQSYDRAEHTRKFTRSRKHQSRGSKRILDWLHRGSLSSSQQMCGKPQKEGNCALSILIVVQLKSFGKTMVLLMICLPAWFKFHLGTDACNVTVHLLNSGPPRRWKPIRWENWNNRFRIFKFSPSWPCLVSLFNKLSGSNCYHLCVLPGLKRIELYAAFSMG